MKNWKRLGYVSVEAVITAALILAVGFFALLNLSGTGSQLVQNGLNKLDDLNIFDGSGEPPANTTVEFDDNGYADNLGITPGDVNPESDFVFEWRDDLGGWSIIDYVNTEDMTVVIPTKRSDNLPIVSVGDSAFEWKYIETLAIPNSITHIGSFSFMGNMLTDVVIPGTVDFIGEDSFENNSLETITLDEGIKEIGMYAFASNQLTNVNIPSSVFTLGEGAFYDNKLTSIVIPDAVTILSDSVFRDNLFESFDIPNHITTIEGYAFDGNQLTTINIPNSVTFIGERAFQDNLLSSVSIPDSVTTIDRMAFYNNQLVSVDIPYSDISIGYLAFNKNWLPQEQAYFYSWGNDTSTLVSYGGASEHPVIPNGTVTIGPDAMASSNLQSVVIPDTVKTLDSGSLAYNFLTAVVVPEGVETLGMSALRGNPLISLDLPDTLKTLGMYSLRDTQLKKLVIPSGVTSIENYALWAPNLVNIRFEGPAPTFSGTKVFYYNFYGELLTVDVPNAHLAAYNTATASQTIKSSGYIYGYEIEGNYVYAWETSSSSWILREYLGTSKSVTVPSQRGNGQPITVIGHYAFMDKALTSVSIPVGIKKIENSAFRNNSLTSVTFPSTLTALFTTSFAYNPLTSAEFNGAPPSVMDLNSVFLNAQFDVGSIRVPSANLAAYRTRATSAGWNTNIFVGY